MSLPWFRLYNETITDPKLLTLDHASKWLWICCLCIASASKERGTLLIGNLEASPEELSSIAGIPADKGRRTIEAFIDRGMLEEEEGVLKVRNWGARQFSSDESSAERVRRYRERVAKHTEGSCNGYMKHRVTVTERDGNSCVYCGSTKNLCLDHMVPLIMGGDHGLDNLATACKACNSGKAGRLPEQAGYRFVNPQAEALYHRAVKRLLKQDVTVTETGQSTDTDTDTDTDKRENLKINHSPSESGSPKVSLDPTPHQKIIDLYHETCPTAPRVTAWTEGAKHLKARWREAKERQNLMWWYAFFQRVAASDFLSGRKAGRSGPFFASLAWMVKAGNFEKILNGAYDSRTAGISYGDPEDLLKGMLQVQDKAPRSLREEIPDIAAGIVDTEGRIVDGEV